MKNISIPAYFIIHILSAAIPITHVAVAGILASDWLTPGPDPGHHIVKDLLITTGLAA